MFLFDFYVKYFSDEVIAESVGISLISSDKKCNKSLTLIQSLNLSTIFLIIFNCFSCFRSHSMVSLVPIITLLLFWCDERFCQLKNQWKDTIRSIYCWYCVLFYDLLLEFNKNLIFWYLFSVGFGLTIGPFFAQTVRVDYFFDKFK